MSQTIYLKERFNATEASRLLLSDLIDSTKKRTLRKYLSKLDNGCVEVAYTNNDHIRHMLHILELLAEAFGQHNVPQQCTADALTQVLLEDARQILRDMEAAHGRALCDNF